MNEIPSTEQQQIIGEWMVSQIEQDDKRYCIEELKEVFFDDDSILEKVKTAAISTQMAVEILNRYFNLFITLPSTITSPDVRRSIPPRMFRQVVLPAPDGPRIQTSSPFSISKEVLFKALISTSPIL